MSYLAKTLELIRRCNDGEERLVPIHADGDGHCLVHAVSRALVGRELFWHPLRCCLKKHFQSEIQKCREQFKDFVDDNEWSIIIDECDPDYIPPHDEMLGLRNIHVFGLANVLKRPIILLDSFECMQKLGDYAALFLPIMVAPEMCYGKDGHLNKPLCIAWSSSGHNHYIPLVGIRKKLLPVLHKDMLPKSWGVPERKVFEYIEFDDKKRCTIGGNRTLGDPYIMRLVSAMEDLFYEQNHVHPSLVADVHYYVYQNAGVVSPDRNMVVQNAKKAVHESRLYRCLDCDALSEQQINRQWFRAGGVLYNMALLTYGKFVANKEYSFPLHGIICKYDPMKNELQPDLKQSTLVCCNLCRGSALRKVRADGSTVYLNDDKTKTPSVGTNCCGFKHYWNGKEYDSPPRKLNVVLDWNGKTVADTVLWFENESDPNLNSNVFQLASELVQKHFPGEFGSERLEQRVVEQLLNQTKQSFFTSPVVLSDNECANKSDDVTSVDVTSPQKIIFSGAGVLHKEELGLSEKEQQILERIREHASVNQMKHKQEDLHKDITASKDSEKMDVDKPEKSESSTNVTVSGTKIKASAEENKFIRVVTSDGRQGKFFLGNSKVSYSQLQDWIVGEFQIPAESQKIKYGFPPQELQATFVENNELPLSHGDRVIVEVIKSPAATDDTSDSLDFLNSEVPERPSSNFIQNDPIAGLLEAITSRNKDPLAIQALYLSITANLSNKSAWNYAKRYPELFKRGGLFYSQMERDVGLKRNAHCNLKTFPEKTFCYNVDRDALELCIEPHGHFAIHENIENDIRRALNSGRTLGGHASSSTSVAQSHTLSGAAPAKLKTIVPEAQAAEKPMEQTSEKLPSRPNVLVRKGPGFSVLGAPKDTSTSSSELLEVNKIQMIANQITESQKPKSACQPSFAINEVSTIGDVETAERLNFPLPSCSSTSSGDTSHSVTESPKHQLVHSETDGKPSKIQASYELCDEHQRNAVSKARSLTSETETKSESTIHSAPEPCKRDFSDMDVDAL